MPLLQKSALHFGEEHLCAEGEAFAFVQPHAFGQADAEAVEQCRLGGIGLGDAAQTDFARYGGWQDDILACHGESS